MPFMLLLSNVPRVTPMVLLPAVVESLRYTSMVLELVVLVSVSAAASVPILRVLVAPALASGSVALPRFWVSVTTRLPVLSRVAIRPLPEPLTSLIRSPTVASPLKVAVV